MLQVDKSVLEANIEGLRCRLTPLGLQHTELVVGWRNNPENAKWFLGGHVITAEGHTSWFNRQAATCNNFNWVIELKEGKPVGMVSLYDANFVAGTAEFGRLLIGDSSVVGRGFGMEATQLVLSAAKKANFQQVYLFVKSMNARAINIYERIGFDRVKEVDDLIEMRIVIQK
ncbi:MULTISPECIES: GNAT family N-acetyltransferase [unclassified Rhizobium]|uniref:GNAT family N-acetyltransferase n=1 Tax=unclassified Rhizobium TaxID=2613769 RepID=UPI0037F305D6